MNNSETAARLYRHIMSPAERKVWLELAEEIRTRLARTNIIDPDAGIIDSKLCEDLYEFRRGYSETDGYYEIFSERGSHDIRLNTTSRQEAMNRFLSDLARDITYRYVTLNSEELEREHMGDWRFRKVKEGERDGRIIYRTEENSGWKYDAEYDYRKLWFELTLRMIMQLLPEDKAAELISLYEGLLNFRFDTPFWIYDRSNLEFVPVK